MKKMITAAMMVMVLMVSSSFAGIYMSDFNEQQPCSASNTNGKTGGVILSEVTGIILAQFTGIILADVKREERVDCGIILAQ